MAMVAGCTASLKVAVTVVDVATLVAPERGGPGTNGRRRGVGRRCGRSGEAPRRRDHRVASRIRRAGHLDRVGRGRGQRCRRGERHLPRGRVVGGVAGNVGGAGLHSHGHRGWGDRLTERGRHSRGIERQQTLAEHKRGHAGRKANVAPPQQFARWPRRMRRARRRSAPEHAGRGRGGFRLPIAGRSIASQGVLRSVVSACCSSATNLTPACSAADASMMTARSSSSAASSGCCVEQLLCAA